MMLDDIKPFKWTVEPTQRTGKERSKLPANIRSQFDLLLKEMELLGPIRKNWKNFSSLKNGRDIPANAYHCHIKKGKPTFVVCYRITSKENKAIEVYYVGTHENAPY